MDRNRSRLGGGFLLVMEANACFEGPFYSCYSDLTYKIIALILDFDRIMYYLCHHNPIVYSN